MVDGSLERRDAAASNAFGFGRKYSKLRKCEPISDHNVQNVLAFCKKPYYRIGAIAVDEPRVGYAWTDERGIHSKFVFDAMPW